MSSQLEVVELNTSSGYVALLLVGMTSEGFLLGKCLDPDVCWKAGPTPET